MSLVRGGLIAVLSGVLPVRVMCQSTMLTALETSPPAPTLELTATALTGGLAGVWSDPTTNGRATGFFFGMHHASYASMQVFHAALAFKLGPRWSLAYASTQLGDLFDSSLTNQDPSLSDLRAQAAWGRLDATFTLPRVVTSLGLALAADDNVGVFQNSTVARAHVRVVPFNTDRVTLGLRSSRAIGGSVPALPEGRHSIDVTFRRSVGGSLLSVTAAASRGALWRYSETRDGYAAAAQLTILTQLDLGAAVGCYRVAFGASRTECYRSFGAAVRVSTLRLGARYTSTRLGAGSGLALSLGYQPGLAQGGPP
jgi:hypothetical protein